MCLGGSLLSSGLAMLSDNTPSRLFVLSFSLRFALFSASPVSGQSAAGIWFRLDINELTLLHTYCNKVKS